MRPDSSSLVPEIESIGAETQQMVGGLDRRNLAKFIDVVGSQLYSNPVGSIVRELTSNCFDSHTEYEKKKIEQTGNPDYKYEEPVIVKYAEEEGQGFVSFIDVGVGLSPSRMKNIYLNFLSSTKENNDDEHGYFGLGAKSFLSYTPSVDVITKYNGTKYHYIVGKNEKGLFAADLLIEEETTEHNGTEVKICIGAKTYQKLPFFNSNFEEYDYRAADFLKFREAIQKQLYYFDNVYTVGFDLENDYSIYEADTFKIRSGENPYKEMHIILGKVAYPIDWGVLNRDPLAIPVGIKFNIGELFVTPSRESIRYDNPEKNNLISNRVDDVINEIKQRYNKNNSSVDTLEEYIRHKNASNRILIIQDVEIKLPKKAVWNSDKAKHDNIDVIQGLKDVKWKPLAHLPIEVPKDPYFIFYLKGRLGRPDGRGNCKLEEMLKKEDEDIFETVSSNKNCVYRIKSDTNKSTNAYIYWKHKKEKQAILIGKTRYGFHNYTKIFNLGESVTRNVTNENNLLQRKKIKAPLTEIEDGKSVYYGKTYLIQQYKKAIIKDLVSRSFSYEKEVPSAAYLSELQIAKLAKKKPKLEGHITIYDLVNGNSSSGQELNLDSLNNYKGFIIYGERDKIKELQGSKEMLSNIPPVQSKKRSRIVPDGKPTLRSSQFTNKKVPCQNYKIHRYGGQEIGRTEMNGYYLTKLRNNCGKVFITAKSNHKLLQGNPYFMHVDEFISNNNRMFRNAVTAWYIRRELEIIERKYSNLVIYLKQINEHLRDSYQELQDWSNKNWRAYYTDTKFMEVCLGIAKEKNMLVSHKVDELKTIQAWFSEDLAIFQKMDKSVFVDTNTFKDVIALLKMKHKRLSAEHYFVPVIEERQDLKTYVLSLEPIEPRLLIYNNQQTA